MTIPADTAAHGSVLQTAAVPGPSLPPEAQRRLGYHLRDLYAPELCSPPDERLAELLHLLDRPKPAEAHSARDDGTNPLALRI